MKTFIAVFAFVVATAPASAAPARFARVDSPNFVVVGDVSARELRTTAIKFEGFLEVLRRVLPASSVSTPVPTVVVVFGSDEAFAPFKPVYRGKTRSAIAGYAAAGLDVNYVAIRSGADVNDRIIFHEYTHIVVSNATAKVPLWLNEGLAEFYSTFALVDGGTRARIGAPVAEHLRRLDGSLHVPLADLLKIDPTSPQYNEDDTASDFYAESWALTHMLLNAQPSRVADLGEYLRRVGDGTPEAQAWEEIFGTARTETDLRRYLTRPIFNAVLFEFPQTIATLPTTDTSLSSADAAAFLAALELRQHGVDAAARILEPALKQEPANSLANTVMAQIEMTREDVPAAQRRLMATPPPSDWFAAYKSALALIDTADRVLGPSTAALARATQSLELVRRDHPKLPNVLASLARAKIVGGGTPTATASEYVARARALAPGRIDYALTQAELFARSGDFARARAVVGPLMTSMYPEDVRTSARELMAGLVDLEQRVSAASTIAPSGRPRSVAVPDGDADKPRDASGQGRFIPVYRELKPGESRLDGLLEAIDCPAGKPVTFRVRTARGVVDVEGQLADIEFLTYRSDLTGGISCGSREPMHVFVSWREGTSPRHEKIVVAVEFLPKD